MFYIFNNLVARADGINLKPGSNSAAKYSRLLISQSVSASQQAHDVTTSVRCHVSSGLY